MAYIIYSNIYFCFDLQTCKQAWSSRGKQSLAANATFNIAAENRKPEFCLLCLVFSAQHHLNFVLTMWTLDTSVLFNCWLEF